MTRRMIRASRFRLVVNALVIVLLIALPMGFVFQRLWASTTDGARFQAAEREGVAWVRPLTNLLAVLVDAQVAATAGIAVDIAAVRAAVGEVSRVEQEHGDPLHIHQRWEPMPQQIDAVLTQQLSGPNATAAYAVPIKITQSLLGTIGDASMIVRDPGVDAYYLIKTSVYDVPDVIVNAGRLTATARDPAAGTGASAPLAADPRAAVALDRIVLAAEVIRIGPRSAADETSGETASSDLLKPLDAFTAATDELTEAALALGQNQPERLADLDRARKVVHEASLALETAALDSLDALLQERLSDIAFQRSGELLAGAAIVLAGILLWLVNRSARGQGPGVTPIQIQPPDRLDHARRRHQRPRPAPEPGGADHSDPEPALAQPTGQR
jgi:hypothetical protein